MIWLWLSAAFMATTALVHGALGEKRLIQPLLALDQGIMAVDLARRNSELANAKAELETGRFPHKAAFFVGDVYADLLRIKPLSLAASRR